jgi:hypothetical protein
MISSLYLRLKLKLKGKGFNDILEIQQKSKEALQELAKQEVHRCLQQWQNQ